MHIKYGKLAFIIALFIMMGTTAIHAQVTNQPSNLKSDCIDGSLKGDSNNNSDN